MSHRRKAKDARKGTSPSRDTEVVDDGKGPYGSIEGSDRGPFYWWCGPCPACGREIDIESEIVGELICPLCGFPVFTLLLEGVS